MAQRFSPRALLGLLLAIAAGAAQAHSGHGTASFFAGLVHPFGLDHLLAMVAVGVWSVSALPGHRVWWGPTTFMLALIAGASLGASGIAAPFLEHLVSLSLILFGALLFAVRLELPAVLGLAVVAAGGSVHGLAHGAESPESGFLVYATGFLLTTAALHFAGVLAGLSIKRHSRTHASSIDATLGVLFGTAGVYLLSQL